jgi:multiple sugar transport system permease protein
MRSRWGAQRLLFILPALFPYVLFVVLPIGLSVYYSLTNLNPLFPTTRFVGLRNYRDLLDDDDFFRAVKNTFVIAATVTLITNVVGLFVALMLNRASRLFYALRTLFFVPQVLSAVIISFIWSIILTQNGILNTVLRNLGLEGWARPWLGLPAEALWSIIAVVSWQWVGFSVVIYLAALQSIPQELYEAARIEGATPVQQFWTLTLPLLGPGVTVNVILIMISVFKLYDHVAVLTSGGPAGTTETLSFNIIKVGFTENQAGYGSAMAVALFTIIGLIAVGLVLFLRRREVEL